MCSSEQLDCYISLYVEYHFLLLFRTQRSMEKILPDHVSSDQDSSDGLGSDSTLTQGRRRRRRREKKEAPWRSCLERVLPFLGCFTIIIEAATLIAVLLLFSLLYSSQKRHSQSVGEELNGLVPTCESGRHHGERSC